MAERITLKERENSPFENAFLKNAEHVTASGRHGWSDWQEVIKVIRHPLYGTNELRIGTNCIYYCDILSQKTSITDKIKHCGVFEIGLHEMDNNVREVVYAGCTERASNMDSLGERIQEFLKYESFLRRRLALHIVPVRGELRIEVRVKDFPAVGPLEQQKKIAERMHVKMLKNRTYLWNESKVNWAE